MTVETLRSSTAWYVIDDVTAAGSARRAAMGLAQQLGFQEHRAAEVGIVASEAAANVFRHAGSGVVGVQVTLRAGQAGVQILAMDQGPGMVDLQRALVDGHSTAGTLGVGLGAMDRLSSRLDVSSQPGHGTVLLAELYDVPQPAPTRIDLGGVTRPMSAEPVSGDAVAGRETDGYQVLLLADGLGHGPAAAAASQEAVAAFHASRAVRPEEVLAALHAHMSHTRGAAVGVAVIDPDFRCVTCAGVGNVSVFVVAGGRRRSFPSSPGIAGHKVPALRALEMELADDAVVVLHSDGVRDGWDLAGLPGLARRSAPVIAASLLRDFGNRPDDASVLVARRWQAVA